MKSKLLEIVAQAIKLKATDIHFNYKNRLFLCELRIFGKLVLFRKYDLETYSLLVNYIRYISQLQTAKGFEPQTGGFEQNIDNHTYFFRTSYLRTPDSETIVLRILNQNSLHAISDLTYDLQAVTDLNQILTLSSGMVLFSGPTGSGKSTTVYTLLEHLALKEKKNIVTIEDPIEKKIEGVLQLQLNEKNGNSYDQLLKQILRHDPDVILVGEIRDEVTAKLTQRCALTGHLVIATIHAFDALSAIHRMVELGISQRELLITLQRVFCQRLFFHKTTHKPFCLFEVLNSSQVTEIFDTNTLSYCTLKHKTSFAYSRGYISEECINYDT